MVFKLMLTSPSDHAPLSSLS